MDVCAAGQLGRVVTSNTEWAIARQSPGTATRCLGHRDADRDNSAHRECNGPGSGLMSFDGERNALI